MAARDYTLTITAAAQRLSSVLADTQPGGTRDEAFRQLILQADTDCFIGASSGVTTTTYGTKIFAATASTAPLTIGAFDGGPIKLSDLYVIGTSGKLHILGLPL